MKSAAIVTFNITERATEEEIKEFNEWYRSYVPRETGRVAHFDAATRFVSGTGKRTMCTLYVIDDAENCLAARESNYDLDNGERTRQDFDDWDSFLERGIIENVCWDFYKPEFSVGWDYFA